MFYLLIPGGIMKKEKSTCTECVRKYTVEFEEHGRGHFHISIVHYTMIHIHDIFFSIFWSKSWYSASIRSSSFTHFRGKGS